MSDMKLASTSDLGLDTVHVFLKVFTSFFKVFVFDIYDVNIFVFKYIPRVFDIFKYSFQCIGHGF